MSGTYRLVFDPFDGEFNLVKIPTISVGGGGMTVTAGVLSLPSGTQVECNIEVTVSGVGDMIIDAGSTILVI